MIYHRTFAFFGFPSLVFLVAIAIGTAVQADGGKVQLSQIIDGQRITVFTSPTPLTTGPVDISFLVQDEASGQVNHDTGISVICRSLESGQVIKKDASDVDSTNKLLQSAKLDLSQPGVWEVHVDAGSSEQLTFLVNLAKPSATGAWLLAVVASPVMFIGLFLLRERISSKRGR